MIADGVDAVRVAVTLVDAGGAPIVGRAVELAATGTGNAFAPLEPTDANGVASTMVSSTVAESKAFTAVATSRAGAAVPLDGMVTAEFVAGPPAALRFVTQPIDVLITDALPALDVAIEDAHGNRVTSESGAIEVAVAENPANATLSGTTSMEVVDGLATFSDLKVTSLGADLKLVASHGAATGVSVAFDVVANPATLVISSQPATATGAHAKGIVVTLRDIDGLAIANRPVSLVSSGSGNTLVPSSGMTDRYGRFKATFVSTVAETKTVTATSGALTLTETTAFGPPTCTTPLLPGIPSQLRQGRARSLFMADFDNDGLADLAVAEENRIVVSLGLGDGSFGTPLSFLPASLLTWVRGGDVDGDGRIDLVAVNRDGGRIHVLRGNGDGTFTLVTELALPDQPGAAELGDFDGDGALDLAVRAQSAVVVYPGLGNGMFGAPTSYDLGIAISIAFLQIALGDLNGDGNVDIITSGSIGGFFTLLSNGNGTFQDPVNIPLGALDSTGTLAVADFDGDTKLDVVLAGGFGAWLMRGNGNGTFNTPSQVSMMSRDLVSADVDGDGHADVVGGDTFGFGVARGNGNGTFQSARQFGLSDTNFAIGVADLNGDGILDVVATSLGQATYYVSSVLGTGTGSFHGTVSGGTSAGAFLDTAGDLDGNGRLDFISQRGSELVVHRTDASGNINEASSLPAIFGTLTALGDFNNDGKLDVLLGQLDTVRWLRGNGDGTLQAPIDSTIGGSHMALVAADFNKDGILDLAQADQLGLNSVRIALGNGDGTFQPGVPHPVGKDPRHLLAHDLDGDGNLDLVVATLGSTSFSVLGGNGDGTFGAVNQIPILFARSMAVDVGDFDNDGIPDVVVATDNKSVSYYRGNGDLTFMPEHNIGVGTPLFRVKVVDLEPDGSPDILAVGGSMAGVLLRGANDGTFGPPIRYDIGVNSNGAIVADFDLDGRTDVIATSGAGFAMLRNRGCQ